MHTCFDQIENMLRRICNCIMDIVSIYIKYNFSYHISSSAKHTQRPGVPHLRILRSRLIIHEGPWQGNPGFNQQIQGFPWNPREPGVLVSTNTCESNVRQIGHLQTEVWVNTKQKMTKLSHLNGLEPKVSI